MRVSATLIAVALSAGIGGTVQAQALQKYITPDGKTIYSDKPVPGAKLVGEVKPPPPVEPAARAAAEKAARQDAQDVKAVDDRLKGEDAQRARIAAAEADLAKAQRALKEGVEPLPGERIGTAGGASRLNDKYRERQKANQDAVAKAQKALEDARAAK